MNQEETKKMEIMGKAEKLQDFIFRITSKRPKKDENGIDIENAGKNNGLPAKYQNSIGVRLQNYSLDMIEILDDIQYDKANRLELLSGLLGVLRHIDGENLVFTSMDSMTKDDQWPLCSAILSFASVSSSTGWVLRSFTVNGTATAYRKEMMIIDLTDLFGTGNEPSKEWCDANILYSD